MYLLVVIDHTDVVGPRQQRLLLLGQPGNQVLLGDVLREGRQYIRERQQRSTEGERVLAECSLPKGLHNLHGGGQAGLQRINSIDGGQQLPIIDNGTANGPPRKLVEDWKRHQKKERTILGRHWIVS
jgi:hypothetical protein